jgi:hypothetical protein
LTLEYSIAHFQKLRSSENLQPQSVSRTCGRCGYVNRLENKYCERSGCNYPLTQLALDEIKTAELQELINQSNLERDNEIQAPRQHLSQLQNTIESSKREMMAEWDEKARLHTKMFRRDLLKETWATGKDMKTILKEMALAGTNSAGVDPFGPEGIVSGVRKTYSYCYCTILWA